MGWNHHLVMYPLTKCWFPGKSFMQFQCLKRMKSSRSLLSNLDKMYRALNSERKNGNSPTTWRSYNKRCKHPAFIVPEALRAEHQAFGNTSLGGRSRVHCQNGGTSRSQGLSRITVLRQDFRKEPWKWGKAFSVHFNDLIFILIHFSCAFPWINFLNFLQKALIFVLQSFKSKWHQEAVNMLQAASLFLPIWMAHLHDVSTEVIREWQLPVGSCEVKCHHLVTTSTSSSSSSATTFY